jgi:hypothetical protein
MAAEWEHLLPLVDLLRAEGNETTRGGFQPNQGGWDCEMRDRLDFAALRPLVAADEHADKIAFEDDRVFCAHCWATITQHTATPLRDLPAWVQAKIAALGYADAEEWVSVPIPALGGRSVVEVAQDPAHETLLRRVLGQLAGGFPSGS